MRRPLPPLRPKRAACGVAGLRSGSGQGQAQHALMAKSLARNHAEAIPLNIYVRHEFFSFFLPHFPGVPRSERPLLPRRAGALWEGPVPFGRNQESRTREVRCVHPGDGTAGAGIWPEAVPRKLSGRKKARYRNELESG